MLSFSVTALAAGVAAALLYLVIAVPVHFLFRQGKTLFSGLFGQMIIAGAIGVAIVPVMDRMGYSTDNVLQFASEIAQDRDKTFKKLAREMR